MLVRTAVLGDAARIAEIHVRAWQTAYKGLMPDGVLDGLSISKRREFWEQRLIAAETTVLVAVPSEVLVGWIAYGRSRDPDGRSVVAEVYGIYVDPNAWRSSAGTALWAEARSRLAKSQIEQVTLWVLAANTRARRFYEANGFRHEVGRSKKFVRGGLELDEVRYRVDLETARSDPSYADNLGW